MNELVPVRPIGYGSGMTVWGVNSLLWLDFETLAPLFFPNAKEPKKMLEQLYSRNKGRFTDRDTVLLKVESTHFWQGTCTPHSEGFRSLGKEVTQKREMRFFSLPRGVIKFCMVSDSPEAMGLIDKALTLHEAYILGKLPRIPDNPSLQQIVCLPPYTRGIRSAYAALAPSMNKSARAVGAMVSKLRKGELVRQPKTPGKMVYVHKKHRPQYDEVLRLRAMGYKLREICSITNVTVPTCSNWTKGEKRGQA